MVKGRRGECVCVGGEWWRGGGTLLNVCVWGGGVSKTSTVYLSVQSALFFTAKTFPQLFPSAVGESFGRVYNTNFQLSQRPEKFTKTTSRFRKYTTLNSSVIGLPAKWKVKLDQAPI